jgi:hypothetical protein
MTLQLAGLPLRDAVESSAQEGAWRAERMGAALAADDAGQKA